MMSVAKVREIPYLKSSHVTSLPSSHFMPSLRVNSQVLPPSGVVPVSVAASATSWLASLLSLLMVYWVRVRFR